ncbi:ABC transporter permease [[Ruminococcus] lactaris]|uniref:ABC transporter permease n=1 Tax=[Ruminococcus] lactaris TaxID=46228 RepID=UPI002FE6D4F3
MKKVVKITSSVRLGAKELLKLIKCEFLKLKRKPLVFISLLLSVFMPLAYAFFLADVNTDVDAVNGVIPVL